MREQIVYVNGRFVTQAVTGVQRVAWETVSRLSKLCKVILLIPRDTDEVVCKKLTNHAIEFKKVGRFTGVLWEQLSLPFYVRRELLINFGNLAPFFKRNQIVYIHDLAVRDAPHGFTTGFRFFYRIAFRLETFFSKKVVTVSKFSQSRISHYYPYAKSKITVINPGVNHIESSENMTPDTLIKMAVKPYNYFLVVGSNNPNKNIGQVLTAFRDNQDLDLAVAGGNFNKVFGEAENQLATSPNIHKLGYVSDLELAGLYRYAACFIFASKYEGFGIPPAEALLSGTPVIAADIPVIREVYGEDVNYFSSSSQLIKLARDIFNNKRRIKSETIERIRKTYSWNDAAVQLRELVNKIREG